MSDKYLYLPGASGNYASVADVNLLDADTAHIHQSIGDWFGNSRNRPSVRLCPLHNLRTVLLSKLEATLCVLCLGKHLLN